MEDSQKIPPLRFNALKGGQLFGWAHPEAYRAAHFVRNRDDFVDDATGSGQQSTRLQGKACLHVGPHFGELRGGKPQPLHLMNTAAAHKPPRMIAGSAKALRSGTSWLKL